MPAKQTTEIHTGESESSQVVIPVEDAMLNPTHARLLHLELL